MLQSNDSCNLFERIRMFMFTLIRNVICLSILSITVYIESNPMNDHNTIQKINSDWITHIKKIMISDNGQFTTTDNQKNSIILEWEFIDPSSPRLNQAIKDASEILTQMYATMELEFAKKYPETISSEMFLKPLAPLLKNGLDNIDWKAAEQILTTSLKQFLTTTDFAKYGSPHDIQIFVTAKDAKSHTLLGVIQFLVMPQFDYGTVKVAMFGVDVSAQHLGIEQLLLSSIFLLIPDIVKIFLHTRKTNTPLLNLCQAIGFAQVAGPLPFWTDMEYLTNNSNSLQATARSLIK